MLLFFSVVPSLSYSMFYSVTFDFFFLHKTVSLAEALSYNFLQLFFFSLCEVPVYMCKIPGSSVSQQIIPWVSSWWRPSSTLTSMFQAGLFLIYKTTFLRGCSNIIISQFKKKITYTLPFPFSHIFYFSTYPHTFLGIFRPPPLQALDHIWTAPYTLKATIHIFLFHVKLWNTWGTCIVLVEAPLSFFGKSIWIWYEAPVFLIKVPVSFAKTHILLYRDPCFACRRPLFLLPIPPVTFIEAPFLLPSPQLFLSKSLFLFLKPLFSYRGSCFSRQCFCFSCQGSCSLTETHDVSFCRASVSFGDWRGIPRIFVSHANGHIVYSFWGPYFSYWDPYLYLLVRPLFLLPMHMHMLLLRPRPMLLLLRPLFLFDEASMSFVDRFIIAYISFVEALLFDQ